MNYQKNHANVLAPAFNHQNHSLTGTKVTSCIFFSLDVRQYDLINEWLFKNHSHHKSRLHNFHCFLNSVPLQKCKNAKMQKCILSSPKNTFLTNENLIENGLCLLPIKWSLHFVDVALVVTLFKERCVENFQRIS